MPRLHPLLALLLPSLGLADIVVDQFGYRTDAAKIALARNPKIGYDSAQSYAPGPRWCLVDSATGDSVLSGSFSAWNSGAIDKVSGDQVWSADFSSWKRTGTYTVVDPVAKVVSPRFRIEPDPYRHVLRHALRTFFYQRAGQEKLAIHAGAAWADGLDHLGTGQDSEARRFLDKSNANAARDLRGGWFQDGGTSKVTALTGLAVSALLKAYEENPTAWTDDLNLPESGNGIPDLIDEALWGIRWLERMQNPDGSCLTMVASDGSVRSVPSSATGPSYYGDASTSSTLRCAATFALASSVLPAVTSGFAAHADTLKQRALSAWAWTRQHPDSSFHTASPRFGTEGFGYMDQEDFGGATFAPLLEASVHLFRLTGDSTYRRAADSCLSGSCGLIWPYYVSPFTGEVQGWIAEYASLPTLPATTRTSLKAKLASLYTESGDAYLGASRASKDPYRAALSDYTWQSNGYKVLTALNYGEMAGTQLPGIDSSEVTAASEDYLHDLHGRNPLGTVMLTNMGKFGATRSANQFYHYWFSDNTKWDEAGVSLFGPPPGFLVSGPNPNYDLDVCCPSNCGSSEYNALCIVKLSPPMEQPPRKSWKDFNAEWPQNSWSVNDNSARAQSNYIRVLSKFVGIPAKQNPVDLLPSKGMRQAMRLRRAPGGWLVSFQGMDPSLAQLTLYDLSGRLLSTSVPRGRELYIQAPSGMGILELRQGSLLIRQIVSLQP